MSGNLRERSCPTGKSGSGGGDDEDAGDGLATKDDSDDRTKKAHGRKVKRVSFFWFRKFNSRKNRLGCFGGGGGGGGRGGGGCNLCMKKPVTLESPVSSPTSDPNSSEFSYDMLRSLIENNNFYDQDCNTHFVIDFEEYRRLPSSSRCDHLKAK